MFDKFLGIDVAKAKFDVALLCGESYRQGSFSNDPSGFVQLLAWLPDCAELQACMEATGSYGLALAHFLHEQGIPVSVVNPAAIRAFGQSELSRAKTDAADARLIARYCRAMAPHNWTPLAPEVVQLQGLVRRIEELKAIHTAEANRAQVPGLTPAVAASLSRHLDWLAQEIADLEDELQQLVQADPQLQQAQGLLCSIPGIGATTANLLLAELPSGCRTARQLAAYAGLVPRPHQSGSSVRGRTRLAKCGNARLRKALYWPAIVAMRHNPKLAKVAQRLSEAGKAKLVIIGALMRKLLCLAFAILKSGQPFDPNYQGARC